MLSQLINPPPSFNNLDQSHTPDLLPDVLCHWPQISLVEQACHIEPEDCALPDIIWLNDWYEHLSKTPPLPPQVPPSACVISTPLAVSAWKNLLISHPNRELVHFFLTGITHCFRIGFDHASCQLSPSKRNLHSASEHPEVIDEYLLSELQESRVTGPFAHSEVPAAHVSRFGVIPKSHQPDKWRLIVDLSHPKGKSVNDRIPKSLCSMSYITTDNAISRILALGRGTLLAKIDVKSAFRLIPVHPSDRHLVAMEWKDNIYIDTCLPFGLRSAPKLNIMADLLAWILEQQGVSILMHYIDDFLTMGCPMSPECQLNLDILIQVCSLLNIPLAIQKVEGPTPCLDFLGIILDATHMEARLPVDKLTRIYHTVANWLDKRNATKREILSLVGLLQHAAKVVHSGQMFVRRIYNVAAKVQEMDHYTPLSKDFHSDLYWWHTFVTSWNGISFLQAAHGDPTPQVTIQIDALGTLGCRAFCKGRWLQWQWPEEWFPIPIMAKEMVPIVLSCAVWGCQLAHKTVLFQCDNTGVVAAVKKGTAKEELVMYLLRSLWFFVAHFDISVSIEHIAAAANQTADQLSRYNMQTFFCSNPQVSILSTPLPAELLQIVAVSGPDWTSPTFRQLFSAITTKA